MSSVLASQVPAAVLAMIPRQHIPDPVVRPVAALRTWIGSVWSQIAASAVYFDPFMASIWVSECYQDERGTGV